MSPAQIGLAALLLVAIAGLVVVAYAVWRHAPRSPAASLLGEGRFAAALTSGDPRAAAVAARHLGRWEEAAERLDALLAEEPTDGELLVERGLAAGYAGHLDDAERWLAAAEASRADLAEPIALHRAWVAARRGDRRRALRLFEAIDAALESKLRSDLGGDPLFAEWFLHAAVLWRLAGDVERADWAWREGARAAPESALAAALAGDA